MSTLTVSSKQTPFPYAAVAVALYTEKAELVFDETATGITLQLNGSSICEEEGIVHALAKAHGLSEDSSKVSRPYRSSDLTLNFNYSRPPSLLLLKVFPL